MANEVGMLSSYLALWAGFEPSTTYLGTYDQLHNSVRANIALNCYSSFSASSQSFFIVSIPFHSFFLSLSLSCLPTSFIIPSLLTMMQYLASYTFSFFLFLLLCSPYLSLTLRQGIVVCYMLHRWRWAGAKEGRKGACTNTPWPCASGVGLFLLKANVGRPGKAKWPFIYIPWLELIGWKRSFSFTFFFSLSLSSDADTQTHLLWKSNLVHNHLHHGAL